MSNLTRRQFFHIGAAGAAIPKPAEPTRPAPKNVLLLMSDQHRPQALGINGGSVAKTPNLDALAREAVRFDSAYCTNPVCVPSRASLLTGLYTHHHKAYNNETPWPAEHKTIAHYLGNAGYFTALIGKMHFVDAQTHGFDYHLDFNDWYQYLGPKTKLYADELGQVNSGSGLPQIDDLWRDVGDPWLETRDKDDRKGMAPVGRVSRLAEDDHFESFVARESIRFLKKHGRNHRFFLISSFLKPHDPFMPSERFVRMFRPEDMQLPQTWGRVDLSTVPREIREGIRNPAATPELRDPEQVKKRIAFYYANLAQMDDNVGKILQTLREMDLEKDTMVLYTSDHGEMLGEHGLWQKFVFYEPSVGVPLIFRAPGVTPRNARCEVPVSLVQIVPTLGELCGLSLPSNLDGASLVGHLHGPDRRLDSTVFAEYNLRRPQAKYMIRRGALKYCHYESDTPELYDLKLDPAEMKNLALVPEHNERMQEMKHLLIDWLSR